MKIIKDDYISKLEAVQILQKAYMEGRIQAKDGCASVLDDISAVKAADVQPVDGWISVKDRMPETNAIGIAHILVYDKMEGVVAADFLDESANYINGSNIFIISNTSTQLYKVTHWMPLPKQPKDGDVE